MLCYEEVFEKCLCKCCELLELFACVFGGVEDEGVMDEVLASEEGTNKIAGEMVHVILYSVQGVRDRLVYNCLD